jgi:RNA polymerase sigma factor (TIGR02999 family)
MTRGSEHVTQLLQAAESGDRAAAADLLPVLYDELRALAGSFFDSPHPSHTLQPTALVHEAYLKLVNAPDPHWSGRGHFFAVAAKAMRQILSNHLRDKRALKRGGGAHRITLGSDLPGKSESVVDALALEEALVDLERRYPDQARIVELRYFAGLGMDETAAALGVSTRTVEREWRMAKAELKLRLREQD